MNAITVTLDDHCRRIERIDFEVKPYQTDIVSGLLAKMIKPAYWGALRHLCYANGEPIFTDRRKEGK